MLGDAELGRESHLGDVSGEEVGIEGLDGFAADLEHSGKTARARIPFENTNFTACLAQSQRSGEPSNSGADDCHITHVTGTVR